MAKTDLSGLNILHYFVEKIKIYSDVQILKTPNNNLLHLSIDGQEIWMFFKCLTYEGNPHPLDNYRAQLPKRIYFEEVKKSKGLFFFVGYDDINDVFVTWDPIKTKSRLNTKTNVSLFSRLSSQQKVVRGNIDVKILTNGDLYVLFKAEDIIFFLRKYQEYFPETIGSSTTVTNSNIEIITSNQALKYWLDEAIKANYSVLDIMTLISQYINLSIQNVILLIRDYALAEFGIENYGDDIDDEDEWNDEGTQSNDDVSELTNEDKRTPTDSELIKKTSDVVLTIDFQSIDGTLRIIDEDRLCYIVESKKNGAFGWRTISKALLQEFVEYFRLNPTASSTQAREDLTGKTNIDKFEYGYNATLTQMAKIILGIEK